MAALGEPEVLDLASGTWRVYRQPEHERHGHGLRQLPDSFSGYSYLALREGYSALG